MAPGWQETITQKPTSVPPPRATGPITGTMRSPLLNEPPLLPGTQETLCVSLSGVPIGNVHPKPEPGVRLASSTG